MEPVSVATTHGYRLKERYNHLLPHTYGRPSNYVLTPYCLPCHDEMFKKAMQELEKMPDAQKHYAGWHNSTFM